MQRRSADDLQKAVEGLIRLAKEADENLQSTSLNETEDDLDDEEFEYEVDPFSKEKIMKIIALMRTAIIPVEEVVLTTECHTSHRNDRTFSKH